MSIEGPIWWDDLIPEEGVCSGASTDRLLMMHGHEATTLFQCLGLRGAIFGRTPVPESLQLPLDPCDAVEIFMNRFRSLPSDHPIPDGIRHVVDAPTDFLSRVGLGALPPTHVLKQYFVEQMGGVEGNREPIPPTTLQLISMSRMNTYLPEMLRLWGPCDVFRRFPHHSRIEAVVGESPQVALLMHTLATSGVLTQETRAHWDDLAGQICGDAVVVRNNQAQPLGRATPSQVFGAKLDDAYPSSSSLHEPASARFAPGFDWLQAFTKLREETIKLMQVAGWKNPEGLFPLPQKPDEGYVRNLLLSLFPGPLLETVEQTIILTAATHRLFDALKVAGISVSPVQESRGGIDVREGLPIDVLVEIARIRKQLSNKFEAQAQTVAHGDLRYKSPSYVRTAGSNITQYRGGLTAYLGEESIKYLDSIGIRDFSDNTLDLFNKLVERARGIMEGSALRPLNRHEERELSNIHDILDLIGSANPTSLSFSRGETLFEGKYSGFFGEKYAEMLDCLQKRIEDKSRVTPNNICINQAEPCVLLGSNGGGKSTLIASILQQLHHPGAVVAEECSLPDRLRVLPSADAVELGGITGVFEGRTGGKSSFVREITQTLHRIDEMLKGEGRSVLDIGDEGGRRTDQLNSMALMAAVLILDARSNALTIHSSHCNALNTQLGPLLEALGIRVRWSTMEGYRLRELMPGETVRSHAFASATPFVPEILAIHWSTMSGEEAPERTKYGVEHRERGYPELHRERLLQLGWLRELSNISGNVKIAGLPAQLLGLDYREDTQRNTLRVYQPETRGSRYTGIYDLYANTLLNPRWEHASRMPAWIQSLRHDTNNISTVATYIEGCGRIFELVSHIDTVDSLRKEMKQVSQEEIKAIHEQLAVFIKDAPSYLQATAQVQALLPGFDTTEITRFFQDVARHNVTKDPIINISQAFTNARNPICILEGIRMLAVNAPSLNMHESNTVGSQFCISGAASYDLQENCQRDGSEPVKNHVHIDLNRSLFFTGPQGSGKTEALYTIGEALFTASLWGLTQARECSVPTDRYEVLPLIVTPPQTSNTRRLSSFENEAESRFAAVVDYCERLPEGVRPVILMDEPLSTTQTGEAADGIIALKRYVESKGGILVVSTHSHECVWKMRALEEQYQLCTVGLFGTDDQFRWIHDQHGESKGIEVAKIVAQKLNLDPRVMQVLDIAMIIREYIEESTRNAGVQLVTYVNRVEAILRDLEMPTLSTER